jgi:S-adenosylmethionine:tRNA ribosyltransferase-isomerase
MSLPDISPEDFDYILPKDRIALYPETNRSDSRLLVGNLKSNSITHYKFKDIHNLIDSGSHLIVNSTKVISARLLFKKPTGGKIEILCVEPIYPSTDPQLVMAEKELCTWKCIIGGRRILDGMILIPDSGDNKYKLKAKVLQRIGNEGIIEFKWNGDSVPFAKIIEFYGITPLPPYIKRDADTGDKENYQTVYAEAEGSVAAPTAGLHFTPELLKALTIKGIAYSELILHVGPGTFLPIESDLQSHIMHSEMFSVSRDFIERLMINNSRKTISTGTTTARTLETLYWIGVKISKGHILADNIYLSQYEPYEYMKLESNLPDFNQSLNDIYNYMNKNSLSRLTGRTQLFIVPGYKFRTTDMLITNFHLPKSTLILLVSAFIGKDFWRKVYNEALAENYRFLSYGDSSLLMV